MKEIVLNGGYVTKVDDEDYERFSKLRWRIGSQNYVVRTEVVDGRKTTVRLHRLITGATKDQHVHHKNRDPLDNQKDNLELKSQSEHSSEHHREDPLRHGPFKGKKYKGVSWHKGFWRAAIPVGGKTVHLGLFRCEVMAARAYDSAVRKYRGSDAYVNFPEPGKTTSHE